MRTIVLGHGSYQLAPGRHGVVRLKLTKKAKRLLAHAKHHGLKVLAIAKVKGGKGAKRKLTFLEKKTRSHKHGKHHGGRKHSGKRG